MLFDQVVGPYLGDGTGLSLEDHAASDGALRRKLMELFPDSEIPVSRMGSLALRALEFGELFCAGAVSAWRLHVTSTARADSG